MASPFQLKNICVVLVEPQGPLNIGSVCRAMMNFGLCDLRLVNPQTDHLVHSARQMAVKATVLLEQASVFNSLRDALDDCVTAFGTTRRFGKYREGMLYPDVAAEQALPLSINGRVGFVFGREDKGLHTAELDLCQRFITIPTDADLPSMNLAQAVALCLYELRRAQERLLGASSAQKKLAGVKSMEEMYTHMENTLASCGYLNPQNPDHILRAFRRIFSRADLNAREVRILRGLWSQIDSLQSQLQGPTND
ncbi:RNA methyltransferase [Geopsychrobacter electrodiphilus]|uniref:RNA methyltransferase n=1 Tax=Geopsychrobacter electrodiphilus TaxID=225196 RepID=UPI0004767E64|nr:RNA methyltransferase [Geopsychrobacter electrodiphilus]